MVASGKSWLKRVLIGLGGLFGVLILVALILPLVINVDKYRPEILKVANENLNGKLDIGKLSLSLWGQVEIDIDQISLLDANGNKVLSVAETYAQISFLSILKGKPLLVFRMDEPDVHILKNKSGQMNVLNLVKEAPKSATPVDDQAVKDEPTTEGAGGTIPALALIAASGVNIEFLNADILFEDLGAGFKQSVTDLNIVLEDISMTRPMNMRIWADIATDVEKTVKVNGPFEMIGVITPEFEGIEFKDVGVDLKINMDGFAIDMGETFQKKSGIPMNIETVLRASASEILLNELIVRFHNAELKASAKLEKLQAVNPEIDFSIRSEPVDLSEWSQLVKALEGLELEGRMDLSASAKGPLDRLGYKANLDIQDLIAAAPGLLARPKMQLAVEVVTNELKKMIFDFEAPGTDIQVTTNIKNFSAPKIRVNVQSKAIDLDQLLPPPAPDGDKVAGDPASEGKAAQPASGKGDGKSGTKSGGTGKEQVAEAPVDTDKSLDPLRQNEFLRNSSAYLSVRVGKFNGMKVQARDIIVDTSFQNLIAGIDKFSVKLWNGLVRANAKVDLKPERPIYNMNLNVNGISLERAIESQMESLRNTLLGDLSFKALGSGKSLNSDLLIKNLQLKGNFKLLEATFATVDVGKMVSEGVNSSLGDISKKVPALEGKTVQQPKGFSSKYKEISSDFTMEGGVFRAPNFKTVSYEKQGIDVHGDTTADLVNDQLDAKWMVIDTYNVTKAHDVDVKVNTVNVEHILAQKGKPVSFPVKVGCKLSEPCYDYASVPTHLGKIAMENVRNSVKGAAGKKVSEAKKKVKKQISKKKDEAKEKANDRVKKETDKLRKRFGF